MGRSGIRAIFQDVIHRRHVRLGVLGACLIGAAAPAQAQDQAAAPVVAPPPPVTTPPSSNTNLMGSPQLRDFSLQPQRRIAPPPQPQAQPAAPVTVAPPPPTGAQPRAATQPGQAQPQAQTRPAPTAPTPSPAAPSAAPSAPPPASDFAPAPAPADAAPSAAPAPVEAPAAAAPSSSYWPYAIALALLALLGLGLMRRRRRSGEIRAAAATVAEPAAAAPRAAPVPAAPAPARRPEPGPRPWLELEFKTERATYTADEAVVAFELTVTNSGGCAARNLRVDVKMFNAGSEQDQEIGAFFRTAGRQGTRLNLPGIGANSSGVIPGEVAMARDNMRAVKLEDRVLFVPVVAVNILYEWGEGLMGQTSKSYVIGRELSQPSEKMGAFRVDQGPRIWRTVGFRPHSLERRV